MHMKQFGFEVLLRYNRRVGRRVPGQMLVESQVETVFWIRGFFNVFGVCVEMAGKRWSSAHLSFYLSELNGNRNTQTHRCKNQACSAEVSLKRFTSLFLKTT